MKDEAKKTVCVLDGYGGGIGATIIKYIREFHGDNLTLVALGTNAIAAATMLKAGAEQGVSGENAMIRTVESADVLVGPVSITWANAILGEVTPAMAEAVMGSTAVKILLPLHQENVLLVDFKDDPLPHLAMSIAQEKLSEVLRNV